MDIWDIQEQDEFESRYADELEMLDGLEEEESTPVSKRSLNFDREKTADNGMTGNGVPMNQNRVKKRDCNEMSVLLSDVEESILDDSDSVSGPCKKRARLSPLQNSKDHDVSRQLPKPGCVKSPFRQLQSSPLQSHNSTSIDRKILSNPERFKVFRRPPMSCEAVSITRMDGQRLYLSIKADKEVSVKAKGLNRTLFRGGTSLQLLSMPFSVLQEHVQDERRRRVMEESEKLTASLNSMLNENSDVAEVEHMLHFNGTEINKEEEKLAQYALWVEKYTPRYFTELLSDDAINRTLLKWLKLWDKVVFGKGQDKENKGRPEQTKKPKPNFAKNYKKQGRGVQEEEGDWKEIDVTGRPVYKVALLCGPPGLGKTTLAHVIARHAGYNVVEMNASDDRSQEIFRNTLEASTQMKSVLGHNEKPNCLVIDEIDGAPAPAINVLLSVIKQKESVGPSIKKAKRKKKASPLSRPIICICNDQYAPALRQLRQVAFLVAFPPTTPARLAARLLEVSRQESINTEMTTLTALCEKTDNDIRSCLNTLQFIHKRHGRVWLEHVQSIEIGQKDSHRSLFSTWKEIFQLPKPKNKRFSAIANNENQTGFAYNQVTLPLDSIAGSTHSFIHQRGVSTMESRFHSVLHLAMSSGQFEKVAQGLFENYLQVKFKDPSFEVVVSGTEWLEFSDFIDQAVLQRQSYILMSYSPFLSVAFHMFYATQSNSKLSYPSSQYESHQNEIKVKNLVQSIKSESAPHIRKNVNLRIACLDLLPFILEVITPALRPVNTQLFSAREKQQLVELIDTMIGYNLTYHQERNFEGQYTYVLDPNIEEAVKFPGLPQHRQLTYAAKQLISREIELEKMRRAERKAFEDTCCTVATTSDYKDRGESKPKKPVVVLSLETSKAKPREAKPALDFFGRPIKAKPQLAEQNGRKRQSLQSKPSLIWFRFNEGYSNAVRKSVKVQEFL